MFDTAPASGWTGDQIARMQSAPLNQWFNGNPNFVGQPWFTDAAEFDFTTLQPKYINRNFEDDKFGQLHGYAFCSGHAQLANGSYLVAGGDEFWYKQFNNKSYTSNGRSDIRVFNPSTAAKTEPELTYVASMYRPPDMQPNAVGGSSYTYWGRWYPSLLALPNEEIMLIGGQHYFFNATDTLADSPTFEKWSPISGPMGPSKPIALLGKYFPINMYPIAYVLPSSGKVWVFAHSESAIVDPDTGLETPHAALDLTKANGQLPLSFPFAGTNFVPMMSYRDNYRMESWICGGVNGTAADGNPTPRANNGKDAWSNCPNCTPVKVCHWTTLEDKGATLTTNVQFTQEDMPIARSQPAAVNLPDGTVAIVSGSGLGHQGGVYGQPQASKGVKEVVIFDPTYPPSDPTNRWKVGAAAPTGRHYHNIALLRSDGTVVTGGGDAQNGDDFANNRPDDMSLDIYYPPYKFIANPPKLVLPFPTAQATYGQQIEVPFVDAIAETIVSVSIIRQASMTHTVNLDQRHIELQILKYGKQKLLVQLPATPSIAPPGNWMLFATDNKGAVVERSGLVNIRATNPNTPPKWTDADTVPTPQTPVKNRDSRVNTASAAGAVRASVAAVAGVSALVASLMF
ncbi:uncharacterized protein EV422DRAFT_545753 [Fimicolochytrium jonesii]|uniref:uncharacterized protein n=1 Tax=Fimicolochytrium jonesii TaxID=1396493 RepID=UPI0022FDC26A|nr:uncharacterized protein EV422DRAFT_545753 [Fimicolochytrium jonesii]KAI8816366.1 hypothetical protein EV422DRAFT_545753 [Fimicolochytrium jonesii]